VMTSLFMSVTGGLEWGQLHKVWKDVHWLYGRFFVLYIFIMHFGIVNVVMATFVAATSQIASKDREHVVKNEIAKMEEYMHKVTMFFREADQDGSGSLSWEEFQEHMDKPHVKAYFQALELDVSQAHHLFVMLDADESNSVGIDEFIEGCVRLRGGARSVDVSMVLLQCKKLSEQLNSLARKSSRQTELIQTVAGRSNKRERQISGEPMVGAASCPNFPDQGVMISVITPPDLQSQKQIGLPSIGPLREAGQVETSVERFALPGGDHR